MPQNQQPKDQTPKKDTTRPRNESVPGQNSVGTTTSDEINEQNSPEVRDALNESQL